MMLCQGRRRCLRGPLNRSGLIYESDAVSTSSYGRDAGGGRLAPKMEVDPEARAEYIMMMQVRPSNPGMGSMASSLSCTCRFAESAQVARCRET